MASELQPISPSEFILTEAHSRWVWPQRWSHRLFILEAEKSKMKAPAQWVSGQGLLSASKMAPRCCADSASHGTRGKGAPTSSLTRALTPSMRTKPSWPNHLFTIAMGIKSQLNFRGTQHLNHSIWLIHQREPGKEADQKSLPGVRKTSHCS
jgi:hypothetical protein